jgi:hypothetical protein
LITFAQVLAALSPWLAMMEIARGRRWMLAPLHLVVVRVGVRVWVQLSGVVRKVLANWFIIAAVVGARAIDSARLGRMADRGEI